MPDFHSWSTTAASNTSVDGVSIAEGMDAADVNNAMREIMENVAAYRDLVGGAKTTGGSSNAYTLTSGLSMAAYQNGFLFAFEANHTNTGASTLTLDGIGGGAKSFKRVDGSALLAGDITSGGIYLCSYESGAGVVLLLTPTSIALATAADWRTGTNTAKALGVSTTWDAAAEVTLTYAATIAVDFSTFINAVVTMTDNGAMGNPTNEKVGQSGVIRIVQDGTGSRTLSYGSDWEFAGGVAPVLSTAASSQDLLFYHIIASNRIYAALIKAIA